MPRDAAPSPKEGEGENDEVLGLDALRKGGGKGKGAKEGEGGKDTPASGKTLSLDP